jgi:AcrR family transcriptional regulator
VLPDDDSPQRTLQQQKQQVTINVLIDATQRAVIEHGLDVTVDEIALLAGVGRRTVFRYFATREDLLDAAIGAALADMERALPEYQGGDWLSWLAELSRLSHEVAARWRRLIWEVKTRPLPARLARYSDNPEWVYGVIPTLWRAAGGRGDPPEELRNVVIAHLSPLFTQAVLVDAKGTPELAAQLTTEAIAANLRRLLGG